MRTEVESIVGRAAVSERPVRDMWPLAIMRERDGDAPPSVLVARPETRDSLAALLRWAGEKRVAATALGGGSGVCGALSPALGEVVIDMGAFDRIYEIDETNLVCRCEAGVNGYALEEALNAKGLTLGHHPTSLAVATVGGLISTRSSGQESTRYGDVENMVQGLTVMLADGTIAHARPGPRSAVGPALHQLFLGAEGGLGIILEAVLRVHRRPESVVGMGFAFPGLLGGLESMRSVMQLGLRPLVMRLYDADDAAFNGYDLNQGECLLVVATAGPAAVAAVEAESVRGAARSGRELGEDVWARWMRHRFDLSAERLQSLLEPPRAYLDTIEIAAPWTVLGELHARIKPAIAVGGLALCHFSHAYEQGCCAYFTFGGSDESEQAARAAYRRAWEGAMKAALDLGATISHHHGVGQVRARWVSDEMGGWMRVWRQIKEGLDPQGILNPRAMGGRS